MAFGGCPTCAEHARINDAGFESILVDGEPGYRLWAGGSLGVAPALAVLLSGWIPRRNVLAAANALITTFVELGDFEHPKKARMKFAIEAVGERRFRRAWDEHYRAEVAAGAGYDPEPVGMPAAADIAEILHHVPDGGWGGGVRPQRRPGVAMVTAHVQLGDLTGADLRAAADLSAALGGDLWITRNQNLQWRDVPVPRVGELRRALDAVGLPVAGADTSVDVRSCTGASVCSLGITESPAAGARIAGSPALGRNGALRVHVSGCPNSCAQHQAGDIGLAGAKVRINGTSRLGYTVFLGADVPAGRLGQAIGRVADEEVEAVVSGVVGTWEVLRQPGERLVETLDRVGADAFAGHVAAIATGFEPGADEATPEPITAA
jgi:sulfite reductase beta subunit-like hemoprotein